VGVLTAKTETATGEKKRNRVTVGDRSFPKKGGGGGWGRGNSPGMNTTLINRNIANTEGQKEGACYSLIRYSSF